MINKNLIKTLGPGIMFAGTCIGGSHLLQSTKAGAYYGFALAGIVLVANLFKYPFFEFASRYTNATGDSILEGYGRINKWILPTYGIITLVSMFLITAAIGALTGGLLNNLLSTAFGISNIPPSTWLIILFSVVFSLLASGKFNILDLTLKIVGIILVVAVCWAFVSVLINNETPIKSPGFFEVLTTDEKIGKLTGLGFAIALMGWMPIAVDMSSWASLWTQERIKQTKYHPTLKETLFDFNFGYIITVILAFFFLTIGALTLFNNPEYPAEEIASMKGLKYSKTLVDMFTSATSKVGGLIILIAAFATMLGTSFTLVDGYCRSLERTWSLITKGTEKTPTFNRKLYIGLLATSLIGSYFIFHFYATSLGKMVNLATITSFIIAPFAAILNFKIMFNKEMPTTHKPPKWLIILGVLGILFLAIFSLLFFIA